jgi:hypothetical protein
MGESVPHGSGTNRGPVSSRYAPATASKRTPWSAVSSRPPRPAAPRQVPSSRDGIVQALTFRGRELTVLASIPLLPRARARGASTMRANARDGSALGAVVRIDEDAALANLELAGPHQVASHPAHDRHERPPVLRRDRPGNLGRTNSRIGRSRLAQREDRRLTCRASDAAVPTAPPRRGSPCPPAGSRSGWRRRAPAARGRAKRVRRRSRRR